VSSRAARIALALSYGLANHALFAVAIAAMIAGLYSGLTTGFGRLEGAGALVANAALALQFPLLHSFLLSRAGRGVLLRLAPRAFAADLSTTSFALFGSLQVLATFALWSPSNVVLCAAEGAWWWLSLVAFVASWALLVVALANAGLELQTGSLGWWSVLRGKRPQFRDFPTHGLFRRCRQPVYLAFALTLWTGPTLTLDRLALALVWTSYCALAPLHKEARYLARYGERFELYRRRTPYLLPRLKA
jgi:protein-S-isoprenylcysteine O-methyltransferase Ste14